VNAGGNGGQAGADTGGNAGTNAAGNGGSASGAGGSASGAGGSSGSGGSAGSGGEICTSDLTTGGNGISISGHPHTLTVPLGDVVAGVEVTYSRGVTGSGHTHSFVLTAAEFDTLRSGGTVAKSVFNGASDSTHFHTVTIQCA
jgi:hypothetical protein